MKNLFSILALVAALLIVNSASAQTINNDSTQTANIEDINKRLDYFSNQHIVGNSLVSTGILVSGIGSAVLVTETKNAYKSYKNEPIRIGLPVVIGGSVISIIGAIINSTAHRKVQSKDFDKRK